MTPMMKIRWFLWRMRLENENVEAVLWKSKGDLLYFIDNYDMVKDSTCCWYPYTSIELEQCRCDLNDAIRYLRKGDVSPLFVVRCFNRAHKNKLHWKRETIQFLLDKVSGSFYEYPSSNEDIRTFLGYTTGSDTLRDRIRNIIIDPENDTQISTNTSNDLLNLLPCASEVIATSYPTPTPSIIRDISSNILCYANDTVHKDA